MHPGLVGGAAVALRIHHLKIDERHAGAVGLPAGGAGVNGEPHGALLSPRRSPAIAIASVFPDSASKGQRPDARPTFVSQKSISA
jgi:hypothetical protein